MRNFGYESVDGSLIKFSAKCFVSVRLNGYSEFPRVTVDMQELRLAYKTLRGVSIGEKIGLKIAWSLKTT